MSGLGQILPLGLPEASDSEIQHLRLSTCVDQDVGGLEITVQYAAAVGVAYGLAYFDQQPDALLQCGSLLHAMRRQVVSVNALHREPGLCTARVHPGSVEPRNAYVFQLRQCFHFALEAFKRMLRRRADDL
ncbi:MAG TPA: hypothetical protein PK027_00905 [Aquimonas sp.]|nr:hypothetical protein [Aquimonas sp.]HRF53004.1 hypothetical protein [Aquimonas sp.]